MSIPVLIGNRIACPACAAPTDFLTISRAARVSGVCRRTIYNYVEEGRIQTIRVAGKTTRVCLGCLVKFDSEPEGAPTSLLKARAG